MANFFLIDHSLRKSGGHHFDYVRCVAQAANELGFMTTIGANRALRKQPSGRGVAKPGENLESLGNVRRVFRETTYQSDSYLAGLQHLTRSESHSAPLTDSSNRVRKNLDQFKRFRHNRRREQFVRRFAVDCDRYFRPLLQMPGDHALLTTVSDLELMGLAVYLSKHVKTLQTNWHLQFHFNLFDGRTPEYEGQQHVIKAVRASCLAALARLSYHSIYFYTTSETLVDQYNRLGVGNFEVLPYPVSQEFSTEFDRPNVLKFGELDLAKAIGRGETRDRHSCRPLGQRKAALSSVDSRPADSPDLASSDDGGSLASNDDEAFRRPLRFTCPGEFRREKGHVEYLQPLVDEIWPSHLATGNAQLVLQRPKPKWYSSRQKIELELPESDGSDAIEYFSHPLDHDAYVELIRSTDCGLLFYDSRVYYSRRAGVLGELLSCGKPVIVPAGSWLAEQIQEPIFRHVDSITKSYRELRSLDVSDFQWNRSNVPMPGGVLSFDRDNHPFEFTIERESNESAMVLEFDWHWPEESGTYCRCEVVQRNQAGDEISRSSQVIGHRSSKQKVNSMFRVFSDATLIEFSLSNAFHHAAASIRRVALRTYDFSELESHAVEMPRGSVGVIAGDQDSLADCVDEMVKHFDHYRATALEFSKRWCARHNPSRTIKHLVMVSESDSVPERRVA